MAKLFLGKQVPKSPSIKKTKRNRSVQGAAIMAVPFLIFSLFMAVSPNQQLSSGVRAVGDSITIQNVTPPGDPVPETPCSKEWFAKQFLKSDGNPDTTKIFPFIPTFMRPGKVEDGFCGPATWSRDVIAFFIYKTLLILNWIAGALAIIFTVWAGILYLTGFMQEQHVKQAKMILIGTYTGLLIVLFARLIVYNTVDLFGSTLRQEINLPVDLDK